MNANLNLKGKTSNNDDKYFVYVKFYIIHKYVMFINFNLYNLKLFISNIFIVNEY